MNKKLVSLLTVAAVVFGSLTGVGLTTQSAYAATAPSSGDLASARSTILAQTNAARAAQGLSPLVLNNALNTVAQNCSTTQATNNNMAHCPGFEAGYPGGWSWGAENVAFGYTYNNVTAGWLNSSGHYANIMRLEATDIGIGMYYNDAGQAFFTQNFAAYASTKTIPSKVGAISATPAGSGTANIGIGDVSFNGNNPVTYEIQATASGYTTITRSVPTSGTHAITGLVGGVTYTVNVRAVNVSGAGAWSEPATVVTVGPPSTAIVSVVPTPYSATVNFTTSANGSPITNQVITLNGRPNVTLATNATNHVFTNLIPGRNYNGTVTSTNALGNSPAAPFSFTTPAVAPDAVAVNAIVENKTNLKVTWTTPAFDGGSPLTGYTVVVAPASGGSSSTATVSPTLLTYNFPGLTRGIDYTYTVTAVNSVGGTPSVTGTIHVPITAPTPVSNVTATLTDEQTIEVNWSAPTDDGGSPLVGYSVAIVANGSIVETVQVTGTTVTFDSDTINPNTNYTFAVLARNSTLSGNSVFSNQINVPATPTKPDVVTNVTVSDVTSSGAKISWAAPANNGGSAITHYGVTVTYVGGGLIDTLVTTSLEVDLTALAKNSPYTVAVVAVNDRGSSNPVSVPVTTLASVTSAPSSASVTFNNNSSGPLTPVIVVGQPTDNGGTDVYDYHVVVTKNGEVEQDWVTTVTGANTTIDTTALASADTEYVATITVVNSAGESNSITRTFTTPVASTDVNNIEKTFTTTTATITWEQPHDSGTYPISGYRIELFNEANELLATKSVNANTLTTSFAIPSEAARGVNNHVTVTPFTHSTNTFAGTPNITSLLIPATVPADITSAVVAPNGTGINVQWVAPDNGGSPITGYIVNLHDADTDDVITSLSSDGTPVTFANVQGGVEVYVTISYANAVGAGEIWTSGVYTSNPTVPAAPDMTSEIDGNGDLKVNFTAWSTGGSPITGYQVRVYNVTTETFVNPAFVNVTGTSYTFTNAIPGNVYRFVGKTVNAVGASLETVGGTITAPAVAPSEPTITVTNITPEGATVTLAVDSDGGAEVTEWNVTVLDGTIPVETLSQSSPVFTVTNLEPNKLYTIEATAVNSAGSSESTQNFATGVNPPAAVTHIVADNGGGTGNAFVVSWDASTVHPNEEAGLRYNAVVTNIADNSVILTLPSVQATSFTVIVPRGVEWTVTVTPTIATVTGTPAVSETFLSPVIAPSAPTNVGVALTNHIPTFTWDAAEANGAAVTYTVTLTDSDDNVLEETSGITGTTFTSAVTLGNNLDYVVTVIATNSAGSNSTEHEFTTPTVAPGAATNVNVAVDNTTVTLTWTAGTTGGSTNVNYVVTARNTTTNVVTTVNTSNLTASFTGLTRGDSYSFVVRSVNEIGGTNSSAVTVTIPATVPTIVTGIVATVATNNTVTATWNAPYNGGSPITGYHVVVTDSEDNVVNQQNVTVRNATIPANVLTPVETYTVHVYAINIVGNGTAGSTTFTTNAVTPTAGTVTTDVVAGSQELEYEFTPVATTGGATPTYGVVIKNGSTVVETNTNVTPGSYAFTGEFGKTYTVEVTATNTAGSVTYSSTDTIPAVVADAPTGLDAVVDAANNTTLTWSAPTFNGGATITGYDYEVTLNGDVVTSGNTATRSVVVNGTLLNPSTEYVVTVQAVNSAGSSSELLGSFTTNVVAPNSVTNLVADNVGSDGVKVNFTTPSVLGGADISTVGVRVVVTKVADGSFAAEYVTSDGAYVAGVDVEHLFTNLDYATEYVVKVTVFNNISGVTVTSNTVVTDAVVPTAPQNVVVKLAGEQSATVSWVAPAQNGGATITGYVVAYTNGAGTVTGTKNVTGLTTVIDGLSKDDTFTFTVTAVNNIGSSVAGIGNRSVLTVPATTPTPLTGETFAEVVDTATVLESDVAGTTITIAVPAADNETWFAGFAYSEPKALGWAFVTANKTVSYDVSGLPVGDHHVALYLADGTLYGVAAFTVAAETPAAETPAGGKGEEVKKADTLVKTGADMNPLFVGGTLSILLLAAGVFMIVRRREYKNVN